ncbi:hypothetical protein HPB47_005648, partial [Ixodes persulcatus]
TTTTMTKTQDVCGRCSKTINGRQQYIACSGTCNRRFHCRCVNIAAAEYELLVQNGVSTYECQECVKLPGLDSAKLGSDDVPCCVDPSGDAGEEQPDKEEGLGDNADLRTIILQLCRKVDVLSSEVQALRADNEQLHPQLSRNAELLPAVHDLKPLLLSVTGYQINVPAPAYLFSPPVLHACADMAAASFEAPTSSTTAHAPPTAPSPIRAATQPNSFSGLGGTIRGISGAFGDGVDSFLNVRNDPDVSSQSFASAFEALDCVRQKREIGAQIRQVTFESVLAQGILSLSD